MPETPPPGRTILQNENYAIYEVRSLLTFGIQKVLKEQKLRNIHQLPTVENLQEVSESIAYVKQQPEGVYILPLFLKQPNKLNHFVSAVLHKNKAGILTAFLQDPLSLEDIRPLYPDNTDIQELAVCLEQTKQLFQQKGVMAISLHEPEGQQRVGNNDCGGFCVENSLRMAYILATQGPIGLARGILRGIKVDRKQHATILEENPQLLLQRPTLEKPVVVAPPQSKPELSLLTGQEEYLLTRLQRFNKVTPREHFGLPYQEAQPLPSHTQRPQQKLAEPVLLPTLVQQSALQEQQLIAQGAGTAHTLPSQAPPPKTEQQGNKGTIQKGIRLLSNAWARLPSFRLCQSNSPAVDEPLPPIKQEDIPHDDHKRPVVRVHASAPGTRLQSQPLWQERFTQEKMARDTSQTISTATSR